MTSMCRYRHRYLHHATVLQRSCSHLTGRTRASILTYRAFNSQAFRGWHDATPRFQTLTGSCRHVLMNMHAKFEVWSFNRFEILAFNTQKFGVTCPWLRPLSTNFQWRHVQTFPGQMHVKFEVFIFNRFEAIRIRTHITDGHTHLKRKPYP